MRHRVRYTIADRRAFSKLSDAQKLAYLYREIEGLTPMGSEFVNDPLNCLKWIHERRDAQETHLRGAYKQLNAARLLAAACEKAYKAICQLGFGVVPLDVWRDLGEPKCALKDALKAWEAQK